MNEWYGWTGTILRIDLTEERVVKEPLSPKMACNFLGGRGVNAKLLFDEVTVETDPLSPENRLILGTGPLTGTLGPSAGRMTITAKSPLTGIFGDSNVGGHFGAELKFAGYDHVVIRGKAKRPVFLWIDDENVELRDATLLWGKTTYEADKIIRTEEIGDMDIRTLTIGPAGENLVRFACIVGDLYRAAGRCGMGAVMGSKNLKAIAVRGSKPIRIAKPEKYIDLVEKLFQLVYKSAKYEEWSIQGTMALVKALQERNSHCFRYYQNIRLPEEKLTNVLATTYLQEFAVKSKACFSCPVHCAHPFVIRSGPYAGTYGGGVEFGTSASIGFNTDNLDLAFICKFNELSQALGLDSMSTGDLIGVAMYLWERGLISEKDTDGLIVEWGDQKAVLNLCERIAYRHGFGNVLADGIKELVNLVGKDIERYFYHIKGLGISSSDIRNDVAWALGESVSTRGADYMRCAPTISRFQISYFLQKGITDEDAYDSASYYPLKAEVLIEGEAYSAIMDSLGMCKFVLGRFPNEIPLEDVLDMLAELILSATNLEINGKRLKTIGERVNNVEKAFNVRQGLAVKDDFPPPRAFETPELMDPREGPKLNKNRFGNLLKVYYKKRGWDVKTGIPTREKLEELGLQDVANKLNMAGKLKMQK